MPSTRSLPLHDRRGQVGVVLAAVVLAACSSSGGAEPSVSVETPPSDVSVTPSEPEPSVLVEQPDDGVAVHPEVRTRAAGLNGEGVQPQGVGTVTARVTSANGDVCDVCLWLASEPAQRSAGLKGVTDLGEPVGMAFAWEQPTSGNFFMFETPTPLSIAWFEPTGSFLASADMAPCVGDDSSTCERFAPGGDYDLAIEMFDGELGVIGIGPGSSVELLDGTQSPTCLVTR